MHRAGGEPSTLAPGKRVALHHMIVAGNFGYGAWRDGGFTIHDVSDPARPKLLSHINWSPPYPGGTHTPLPLPGRKLALVADEANARSAPRARSTPSSWTCARPRTRCRLRPCRRRPAATSAASAPSDRTICTRTGRTGCRARRRSSPPTTTPACRIFDLANQFALAEVASWLPPPPAKLIDPRPNVARAAKSADLFVTRDGLIYVSDWNAGLNVLEYRG
jgi:hypothetical protein